MNTEDRIKLFVGVDPNGCDAESQMVLEYTAKKNSSLPVDITWMQHSNNPESIWSNWRSETWATPFSGFRWGIPAACNYEGQAIYMDSDMIILGDLAELWKEPWNDTAIIQMKGDWRTCVAKWHCARAGKVLPAITDIKNVPNAHQQLFTALQHNPGLTQVFDRQWNNFDGENDKLQDIKILHYTDMSTQMHLQYAIPRLASEGRKHWYDGDIRAHRRGDVQKLFDTMYMEAQKEGYTPQQYYDMENLVDYKKESQAGYRSNNGFDVTQKQ